MSPQDSEFPEVTADDLDAEMLFAIGISGDEDIEIVTALVDPNAEHGSNTEAEMDV